MHSFVRTALYLLACTTIAAAFLDDFVDIYDYVVIGGGGAGMIMANRLSEDPTKTVVVLNRGDDDQCDTCDKTAGNNGPAGSILNNGLYSKDGANYFTTPNLFPGRSIREVRTNLPGGNTRLYGGTSIPSAKALINKFWPADVNYDVMRPYFNKWQDHFCNYFPFSVTGINATDCATYHGNKNGPMSVSPVVPGPDTDIAKDFLAAGNQFGIKAVPDPFNPTYQAMGTYMYAQHSLANRANPNDINSTRTRESTYTGYLTSAVRGRPNLDLVFGAEGRELIFNTDLQAFPGVARLLGVSIVAGSKPKAIGVKYYLPGDEIRVVFARKHMVLCGGVEGSIKFLQHNGIGPADLLNSLNITVRANNPHIGQRITAHAAVAMSFKTKIPIPINPSNSGKSVVMQISSPTNNGFPDIEVEMYLGGVVNSFDFALTGTDSSYFTDFSPTGLYPYISVFVEVVDPVNRGSINVTSDRFEDPSQVEYGWSKGFDYGTSADYNKTMYGFKKMREAFLGNNTFSNKYIVQEHQPGTQANAAAQFNSDLFYSAYNQHSIYHTNGGVSLGKATNSAGLLNGVTGLSVCDNSVLPYSPNGNPSSTMFALCEYIADKIKTY